MGKTLTALAAAGLIATLAGCAAATEDSAESDGMIRMVATHEVADYDTFIAGYDAEDAAAIREAGGVEFDAVYRQTDNPNDLMIVHDFSSMDQAAAYVESPDLKAAMEALGVIEPPIITFYTR